MAFKLLDGLLDLLFPPRCPFCRALLQPGEIGLCRDCREALPYTSGEAAVQTGAFFSRCISPLFYQDDVRESFHRFKFEGRSGYAGCYGILMTQCVRRLLPSDTYDLITWVPLSKKRKKKRGYDQAMLLAAEIGAALSCPVMGLLFKKERPPQSSLQGVQARLENSKNAYSVLAPEQAAGKRILLVDDIITTGATLSECARKLLEAGATEVLCVTLARGL